MEQRPRRRNPHVGGIHGPIPPRHPRRAAGQMVWPRDKKGSSIWSWGRLKDILTSRGPDIWCSRRGSLGPHRPVWSNWRSPNPPAFTPWDNLGYLYKNEPDAPHWFWAERPQNVRYDFKTRKYRVPDLDTWTDAKYSEQNNELMYHRDVLDGHIIEPRWQNPWGDNPFAYSKYSHDGWDGDEIPHVY